MVPSRPTAAATRGRPPSVTPERLREAILEIEGEVPTMQSLARQLGVSPATLYSHIRGQDELHRLCVDTVFDANPPAPAEPGTHWAVWVLEYARDARRLVERYPVAHGTRPLTGGPLRYLERVLAQLVALGMTAEEAIYTFHQVALLILGVGAQIEAERLHEVAAGLDLTGRFQKAMAAHPAELPILSELGARALPDMDAAFDELVWFTLSGIARQRSEVLPAEWPD